MDTLCDSTVPVSEIVALIFGVGFGAGLAVGLLFYVLARNVR